MQQVSYQLLELPGMLLLGLGLPALGDVHGCSAASAGEGVQRLACALQCTENDCLVWGWAVSGKNDCNIVLTIRHVACSRWEYDVKWHVPGWYGSRSAVCVPATQSVNTVRGEKRAVSFYLCVHSSLCRSCGGKVWYGADKLLAY